MSGKKTVDLSNRVTELDLIRGICILGMAVDHAFAMTIFMLPSIFQNSEATYSIYKFGLQYWNSTPRLIIHLIGLSLFLLLTGVCCSFSRSNIKRGTKLLIVSVIFTVVTIIFMNIIGEQDEIVTFGVLHCIAVCLLLVGVLEKIKTNKWIYLAIGLVMIVVGVLFVKVINEHGDYYVSYSSESLWTLVPKIILGLSYAGADCIPLFPYGGVVFVGVFLGKQFYSEKKPLVFKNYHNNIVTILGRHTLVFYLVHLLIIVPIWVVVYLILGAKLTIF